MDHTHAQYIPQDQKEVWNLIANAWIDLIKNPFEDPNREKILSPALERLLGNVRNKSILDIGCGEGSLCRLLAKKGARVTGLDFSERLIEYARKQTSSKDQIEYVIGYAEEADSIFEGKTFNICIANMSMICFENINLVISKVSRVLESDGEFVFSILHPCFPLSAYENAERVISDPGFNNPEKYIWPNESYFNRRQIYRKIRPNFPVVSSIYRRTLEEYSLTLAENGFVITHIIEPKPSRDIIEDERYEGHNKYSLFPFFLLICARKIDISLGTDLPQEEVLSSILTFREERDWGKFQTIKNNAISLALEASELLEHFHWLEDQDELDSYTRDHHTELKDELADVYINLLVLANDLKVNLNEAAKAKLAALSKKYPKYQVYGESVKPSMKSKDKARKRFR